MTHNSTVNLKLIHFLLWTKESYQGSNFDTFECSGENLPNFSCHFLSNKSVFIQILHRSSISWKIAPLFFLAQTINTLLKRIPLKCKFEYSCDFKKWLLSTQVKVCRFWNNKSIPLQAVYPYSVSWKITPLYFFSSNNIYFAQKNPIKMKLFETSQCSGQILSNSLCQFWNNQSIPLQILYPSWVSWKITSLYFFG